MVSERHITMNRQHSLVIVSKALAPYRVRFYSEVAKALNPHGWEVTLVVATLGAKDHPWSDPGLNGGSLKIVGAGAQSGPSRMQKLADHLAKLLGKGDVEIPNLTLLKALEERNADVVWTHEYSPFCLAASLWAAFRDRGSILSTDLGSNPPKHSCTPGQLRFQKAVSFLYEGVIANTKEATRRNHPDGAPVIFAPHAIDTDQYLPAATGREPLRFRFLFTGGIRQEKGIVEVIEAGRLLAREGYDFEIRAVGTGPLSEWLANQTDPWLSIGGFVEGAALCREYREADVYVLPTEGDTYAVTVHEAAASGLPLIVGKTAGAVETLVEEGVSGFAIDPHNIPELASRMRELLDDRPRARSMGIHARELAELWDVKLLGKRTADFVLKLSSGTIRSQTRADVNPPLEIGSE